MRLVCSHKTVRGRRGWLYPYMGDAKSKITEAITHPGSREHDCFNHGISRLFELRDSVKSANTQNFVSVSDMSSAYQMTSQRDAGGLQTILAREQKITGAINIPLAELESRLGDLDKLQWIITYCT